MRETGSKWLEVKVPDLWRHFGEELLGGSDFRDQLEIILKPAAIRAVLSHLKTRAGYEILMDLFGMDYLKYAPSPAGRFAVIYNLYSLSQHNRLRLKVYLSEHSPEIDSIHDIYRAANWFEREVYDLFGILFRGHPHLVRILCHEDFVGHPLRKDYLADHYQRLKQARGSGGI